ncbi:hypothetical protein [Mongoliitalea lutea]|uniref:hypothetical protein n=1 Tax=Mongoliitalea lutea TaxID=849756 RepID=UPI001E5DBBC1|nr:hypothetical protein [Mongoliitalea lutea]
MDTRAREKGRKSESNIGNVTRSVISLVSVELAAGGAHQHNRMTFLSDNPSQYPIFQTSQIDLPRSISSDDTLNFRSLGQTAIPLHIAGRVNLFNTITLGGGYGREFGSMGAFQASPYEFVFENTSYTFDKVFGTLGIVLYDAGKRAKFLRWRYRKYSSQNFYMQSQKNQRIRQNYPWRFMVEGQFGNISIRENIDPSVGIGTDPFFNVSFRIERDFSEYSRLFLKAGYETRNFLFQAENPLEVQSFRQILYPIQVGLSVSLPGTKRCKKPGCGVVMKHLHDGVEYRGSSIFQLQNRKVGQWY